MWVAIQQLGILFIVYNITQQEIQNNIMETLNPDQIKTAKKTISILLGKSNDDDMNVHWKKVKDHLRDIAMMDDNNKARNAIRHMTIDGTVSSPRRTTLSDPMSPEGSMREAQNVLKRSSTERFPRNRQMLEPIQHNNFTVGEDDGHQF
jgi:hypothetical protein